MTKEGPSVTFKAQVEPRANGGIAIRVPSAAWDAHRVPHVTGSIAGRSMRGTLTRLGDAVYLQLGPAWCRDSRIGPGREVDVTLMPEGPQLDTLADDLQAALVDEPGAADFFASLATFYRKGYVRWIEQAKRPETRARRIAETVSALKAGRKER